MAVLNDEAGSGSSPATCYGSRVTQAGEGHSNGFVDEADVDTIEMELRPEDLARLAQISGAEAAAPVSERDTAESIQAELAAGLEARPTEAAASAPQFMPAPDVPVSPAPRIVVSIVEPGPDSEPEVVSAPSRPETPVSRQPEVTVSPVREAPIGAMPDTPAVATPRRGARRSRWAGPSLIALLALAGASVWLSSLASFHADDPLPPARPMATVEADPPVAPLARPGDPSPATPVGDVLRYRNPFDAAEVFEFPPGTSRADARRAVAAFLLQRACERQNPPAKPNHEAAETPCGQARTPAELLLITARNVQ